MTSKYETMQKNWNKSWSLGYMKKGGEERRREVWQLGLDRDLTSKRAWPKKCSTL